MRYIYTFSVFLYGLLIRLSALKSQKAKQWINGRKNWQDKLLAALKENRFPVVWIHCSSLGEFEQGRPVIEEVRAKYSNVFILLSFFSPSGYEIRKSYQQADYVCYLPLDTLRNAKEFIQIVNPKVSIFIKYDFWYNYINQLKTKKIPIWLVSGIFRPSQHFFRFWGGWFRRHLAYFDHMFIQNEESGRLLDSIGIVDYTVAGDTRFDRVKQIAFQAKVINEAQEFINNRFAVIAGSTWPSDEDILIEYINQSDDQICFIIAPHEIDKVHIEQIILKIDKKQILFSEIEKDTDLKSYSVLIIDNIGMLSALYRYGNLVIIGGGFGKGIHNILEPAVHGVPIIIGPKYFKFQEAIDLVQRNTVFPINNFTEFENRVKTVKENPEILTEIKTLQHSYIHQMSGSTSIIVERLKAYLN